MSRRAARHAGLLALLALGPAACGQGGAGGADAGEDVPPLPALRLLRETKISKIVPLTAEHFEASGLTSRDGRLYVVFDNMTNVALVAPDLSSATTSTGLVQPSAWEGITYHPAATGFRVIQESPPQVAELDADAAYVTSVPVTVTFPTVNKGFEGAALVTVGGAERLLALCEGNLCTDNATDTGHGQMMVLARQGASWTAESTIALPPAADFIDYSDIALQDNGDGTYRMALLSQESSMLWIGTLETSPLRAAGPGVVYEFPKNVAGAVMYCTLEGVTFLSATELAFVSDKSDATTLCNTKDESIHVFALP